MPVDFIINGLTFIFIVWRLVIVGSFLVDKESSKSLKWIVVLSFLIFFTALFSSIGTQITVKEIWKYLRRFLMLKVSFTTLKHRLDTYKKYRNFFKLSSVKLYKEKIAYPSKNSTE